MSTLRLLALVFCATGAQRESRPIWPLSAAVVSDRCLERDASPGLSTVSQFRCCPRPAWHAMCISRDVRSRVWSFIKAPENGSSSAVVLERARGDNRKSTSTLHGDPRKDFCQSKRAARNTTVLKLAMYVLSCFSLFFPQAEWKRRLEDLTTFAGSSGASTQGHGSNGSRTRLRKIQKGSSSSSSCRPSLRLQKRFAKQKHAGGGSKARKAGKYLTTAEAKEGLRYARGVSGYRTAMLDSSWPMVVGRWLRMCNLKLSLNHPNAFHCLTQTVDYSPVPKVKESQAGESKREGGGEANNANRKEMLRAKTQFGPYGRWVRFASNYGTIPCSLQPFSNGYPGHGSISRCGFLRDRAPSVRMSTVQ